MPDVAERARPRVSSRHAYLTAGLVLFPPEPGTLDVKLAPPSREQGARAGLEAAEPYRRMVLEGP